MEDVSGAMDDGPDSSITLKASKQAHKIQITHISARISINLVSILKHPIMSTPIEPPLIDGVVCVVIC